MCNLQSFVFSGNNMNNVNLYVVVNINGMCMVLESKLVGINLNDAFFENLLFLHFIIITSFR